VSCIILEDGFIECRYMCRTLDVCKRADEANQVKCNRGFYIRFPLQITKLQLQDMQVDPS
jgi:hypothetical protein